CNCKARGCELLWDAPCSTSRPAEEGVGSKTWGFLFWVWGQFLFSEDVFFPVTSPGFSTMFGKKKKRLEISGPSNFEHRVHTGFDHREQKFTGLPQQWHSLLADTANRPKPMVDPSCITPIQLAPMKVLCKVFLSCCL
uniref:non-specific serine/threonine protein kinase n=1 Tax=Phasianus colchicus TaxID=9054 RepID=A0A669P5L2_PHACC